MCGGWAAVAARAAVLLPATSAVAARAAAEKLGAGRFQRPPSSVFVVDDEAEMARPVRRLRAAFHERDELVADIDERRAVRAAAERELEDLSVERERLLDR